MAIDMELTPKTKRLPGEPCCKPVVYPDVERDQAVRMAAIARALADAGVNIYGHLFLGRWGDRAMFAFVVDDAKTARPILERKG